MFAIPKTAVVTTIDYLGFRLWIYLSPSIWFKTYGSWFISSDPQAGGSSEGVPVLEALDEMLSQAGRQNLRNMMIN